MLNPSRAQSYTLAGFTIAILALLMLAAPSAPFAARPPHPSAVYINLGDTGKTVPVRVGQQLVVKLPMRNFDDNTWHISKISPSLKLVAGPDELRPSHWSAWKPSFQIFYFRRLSPGTADLVMEPSYFSKPLVIKVVDG